MTAYKDDREMILITNDLVVNDLMKILTEFPPFNGAHEGYANLLEEVDELWDEVKANNKELAVKEAIQVASTAMRFVIDVCLKYELDPDDIVNPPDKSIRANPYPANHWPQPYHDVTPDGVSKTYPGRAGG